MGPTKQRSTPNPHFTPNKTDYHFVKGSKVEVTSKDEGFVGSWFEATIIKPPEMHNSRYREKRMTLVEYANLLNDDASLLLRDLVDAAMLRPFPPGTEEDGGFEVGDIVDAFEKEGWWTGVVDRIVKGEGEEVRYVVSFAEPKHEIEFGKDSMRLHLDWMNGKWFRFWNGKTQELSVNKDGHVTLAINGNRNYPKENFILNPPPTGGNPEYCIGMTASMNEPLTPLNGNEGAISPPSPSNQRMGPKEQGSTPHAHFTPNKTDYHLVKGSKVEVTSKDEGFVGSWFEATVIKPPEMHNSRSREKRMILVEYANLLNDDGSLLLREHVDTAMLRPVPPGTEEYRGFEVGDIVDAFEKDGWWTGVVDRIVNGGGEEVRYVVSFADPKHEIEFGKDSMRLHLDWMNGKWFRFWNGKTQELSMSKDGRETLAINGNRNYPKENFILNPAPTGCDPGYHIGMTASMNEQLTPLNGKPIHPLLSSCRQDIIDLDFPSSSFSDSRPAKKPKTCAEEPLAHAISKPAEFLRDCKNKDSNDHITSTSHEKHNASARAKRSKKRAGRSKGIPNASVAGAVSKADDVQEDLSLEEKLTEAVGTEFSLQEQLTEAPKADSADNNPHMQELTLVAVGTELNPKEQGHSDLVHDERTSPVTEGMVVLNEQQQSAPNDVSVIGPSLPFLITSPLWKTVESFEIFRKFPQQPHFLPLIDARERFREGLAIAKMVTFSSTAANAINLSIDDNIHSITECLETLQSLELHGFDAKTLQRHLVKLISLKEMQKKIEEEKNELEGQVSELKHEIVKVREEISEAVGMIKFYQDKLESALLKEEEKHHEILALETSMDVLDTVICSARLEFEDSKDTW